MPNVVDADGNQDGGVRVVRVRQVGPVAEHQVGFEWQVVEPDPLDQVGQDDHVHVVVKVVVDVQQAGG